MNKTNLSISDKNQIRAEITTRIGCLSEADKNIASYNLCKALLQIPEIQKSTTIIGYTALDDEISLAPFYEIAENHGKYIICITPGGHHASLPTESVILVPGRAFTLSGKRIGRGGGWYDKFLQKHLELYSIGVCFDCQICADLPQDTWDIPLNTVVYSGLQRGQ